MMVCVACTHVWVQGVQYADAPTQGRAPTNVCESRHRSTMTLGVNTRTGQIALYLNPEVWSTVPPRVLRPVVQGPKP